MTDLDDGLLSTYLHAHVSDFAGPVRSKKFNTGQSNPTYLLEAASGRYVLRRKPSGELLQSAHAIDREFKVLRALHGGNVPVAKPLHYCADTSVIGQAFYIMQWIDGTAHFDPSLPGIEPKTRTLAYTNAAKTLAAIHRVNVDDVGLGDFAKPQNYFARQLKRWGEQYAQSVIEPNRQIDELIAGLHNALPASDDARALVHGDFRLDNLLFNDDFSKVLAVVDWELSTLGNPLSDVSYFCMALRLPKNPMIPGLAGIDRAPLGIPEENAWLDLYVNAGGVLPEKNLWNFALAFNFFRLTAIVQGVYKRSQQGNASHAQAARAGEVIPLLASMGLQALAG
jgi:aminoglycoside phosphotransferase (APT) family kinase protein